jgi:capsular exopolysaccharide synthesis family protein
MSINEELTQSEDFGPEQAITIQPSSIATYPGGGDWSPAGGADAGQDSLNGMALLHAVRRHWLVILSVGLACAAVTATTLFMVLTKEYKAEATLELKAIRPVVMSQSPGEQSTNNEFDIFRDTQKSLITSRYVVIAALRDPKLKSRACIQREDAKHNAIAWLTGEIHVDFPSKNAGVMQVSATEPDKEDAAAIVNAVVNAYRKEIVDKDREQRRERYSELQKLSAEKENDVRSKRELLKRELENAGGADEQTMAVRSTMAVTVYQNALLEFNRMKAESRALLGRMKEAEAFRKDLSDGVVEIAEPEIAMLLNTDPLYRDLKGRLGFLQQLERMNEDRAVKGPISKQSIGHQQNVAELAATKARIDDLKNESREQIRNAKRIELERDFRRMKTQLDVYNEQLGFLDKEVEKKQIEADASGRTSINAQMAKAEVENLEHIVHNLAEEREHLKIELNSPERVVVWGDDPMAPAAVPENQTRDLHWLIILFGSALAMAVPALAVVLWDLRKERINSTHDVSKRLKIPVMGTVPMIPAVVMRRLGDSTKKSQLWKSRFTEAVDGVAARLLRKAECDQCRVILITSAMSGEGKTTLATQLAMSLARAHRRTILVDFDLRQPTLDGALGLPLVPGVCEALRGDGDVMDMVQQTDTEFLSVITAGAWNRRIPAALGNGAIGAVLEQLRKNFDFVIIDSSPLLPVVDTRMVSTNVDAVVLSVFRDISQGSKVLAAQELLDAFGARCVEAVITGGEEHGHAKNRAYLAALPEEPPMPAAENALERNAAEPKNDDTSDEYRQSE